MNEMLPTYPPFSANVSRLSHLIDVILENIGSNAESFEERKVEIG